MQDFEVQNLVSPTATRGARSCCKGPSQRRVWPATQLERPQTPVMAVRLPACFSIRCRLELEVFLSHHRREALDTRLDWSQRVDDECQPTLQRGVPADQRH